MFIFSFLSLSFGEGDDINTRESAAKSFDFPKDEFINRGRGRRRYFSFSLRAKSIERLVFVLIYLLLNVALITKQNLRPPLSVQRESLVKGRLQNILSHFHRED